jgi:hypothetical protein
VVADSHSFRKLKYAVCAELLSEPFVTVYVPAICVEEQVADVDEAAPTENALYFRK